MVDKTDGYFLVFSQQRHVFTENIWQPDKQSVNVLTFRALRFYNTR